MRRFVASLAVVPLLLLAFAAGGWSVAPESSGPTVHLSGALSTPFAATLSGAWSGTLPGSETASPRGEHSPGLVTCARGPAVSRFTAGRRPQRTPLPPFVTTLPPPVGVVRT